MAVGPGSALAHYKISDALGEGGMGQVWRAEDSKLGREVALKVLPEEFADDADRMARFEREARVLANLNHPNIATLYGLETVTSDANSSPEPRAPSPESSPKPQAPSPDSSPEPQAPSPVTFLAMELVEGEDLSERIQRGPIPVSEAIPIALQIAEALEAAHEQGIVHRDLKPANIKLRPDGTVKVLDFGLAKAWESDHSDSSLSLSPTVTSHATAAGLILGTAAYMSPEQAAGTPADRRADIWSFGVVFWEMLTGHKLFEGETVSHVLASVLKDDVDFTALPAETPGRLHELIERCLRKKPKQRLQAIGEARIVLEEYQADPVSFEQALPDATASPPSRPVWRQVMPWAMAFAVIAAMTAVVLTALTGQQSAETAIRFQVPPPEGRGFQLDSTRPGPAVVSPDGRSLAFAAWDTDGQVRIFVRNLDEVQPRVLAGTENAQYPFWAPDSKNLGFFAEGKLKKVSASGGQPLTLCDAPDGKGGSWSPDGVILFAPSASATLQRVSQLGGEPVDVTEFDEQRGDDSHRHPRFLPDGKSFIYLARFPAGAAEGQAVVAATLDGDDEKLIVRSPAAAEYASGYLLFLRERTLMAQPFDPDRFELSGEPVPIADEIVLISTGTAQGVFSASQTGVLAVQSGLLSADLVLRWRGRDGQEIEAIGEPARFTDDIRLSPDERTAIVQIRAEEGDNRDLWVVELDRRLRTRFTFGPEGDDSPVFSPDGQTVIWTVTDSRENFALNRKTIGGAGDGERLDEFDKEVWPAAWHPGSDVLLLARQEAVAPVNLDLMTWRIGDDQPQPWLGTEFIEYDGSFSPDGRWLAYGSNESGEFEVYVAPFPGPGRKWQVSVGGGGWPVWRGDGAEIVYNTFSGELKSVAVEERGDGLSFGQPQKLFDFRSMSADGRGWAVTADGQRFLVVEPAESAPPEPVTVIVNWPAAIEAQR